MVGLSRIGALFAIVGLCLAVFVPIAHADTPPDTAQIEAVRVFRHMLEPNDVFMLVRFDVSWGNATNQPDGQSIAQTYEFTYSSEVGNITLGNETASPLFNNGYAKGLVAFYWADDDALKPTYGDLGNVTMTGIDDYGNYTYTLETADYSAYAQPSEIREDLRQWTISQLMMINWDWNQWYTENGSTLAISLLAVFDAYTVLDSAGEAYMQSVHADFKEMCPALFLFNTAVYDYENEEWTLAQQSIYEMEHASDIIGNITEGLKDLTGDMIDTIWITTFVTCIMAGALIFACNYWWLQAKIGALGAYLIVLVATPEGFFQMGLMALVAVVAVLYLIDIFFWKRSAG